MEDLKTDVVEVSEYHDPIKIREEDFDKIREIQILADTLSKYRQEIGRLNQVIMNMIRSTDEVEVDLSSLRKELVSKYTLEGQVPGQWAIDFQKRELVKLSDKAPVIP